MTPVETELLPRIAAFEFDEGAPAMTFAARLAKDNGWSKVYAMRVIDEYRKFAFLTIAAGHIAVPSDQVDQAWHQHLLYTRSWSDFCANALQMPLHHDPTRGGESEQARFKALYEQTLQSYRLAFGKPPEDIWPATDIRFGRDLAYRRVNVKQNIVIPRFWMTALAAGAIAFVMAAVVATLN